MPHVQLDLPGLAAPKSLRAAAEHLLANALECRIDTVVMHQRHVRMLLESFGADTPVTAIGYPELRRYYVAEQRRGMSRETVRKRLSTLHMILAEAERQGWVDRIPPWVVIKTDSRPKAAFWTLTDWRAAHLACDDEDLRTWIALGFWFGLHTRDLNSYRWCDVDLARRTWTRRNHKTGVAPVELPLPDQVHKLLRERHEQLQPHRRDLICTRNLGNPNRALKALCLRAGVTVISPIGLRHSCETFLDESGTTEAFQVAWMGLRSPAMLKRHYRHVTPAVLDGGIAAINAR